MWACGAADCTAFDAEQAAVSLAAAGFRRSHVTAFSGCNPELASNVF